MGLIKKRNKNHSSSKTQRDNGTLIKKEPITHDYVLVTLHRPANVDRPETFREILLGLKDISKKIPVVFPAHPRTQKRIKKDKMKIDSRNLHILKPFGYLDFLTLMRYANLVITDSGGIQEETTYLGIPCLTVRPNTERPITTEIGTNQLVASKRKILTDEALKAINKDSPLAKIIKPTFWDGRAAQRIIKVLSSFR